MLVRKLRLYRMKAGMTLKSCSKELVISYSRMVSLENCFLRIRTDESKYLAKFFNTTPEEICKIIDMDIVSKSINKFRYVVNREDVPQEEIDELFKKVKDTYSKNQREFKLRRAEKFRNANKLTKSFKCLNQACRLNSSWTNGFNGQKCMCDNPVVVRGDAPCYGKDKVQSKPKRQGFDYYNTKNCFMKDKVLKEERKKHYAL